MLLKLGFNPQEEENQEDEDEHEGEEGGEHREECESNSEGEGDKEVESGEGTEGKGSKGDENTRVETEEHENATLKDLPPTSTPKTSSAADQPTHPKAPAKKTPDCESILSKYVMSRFCY